MFTRRVLGYSVTLAAVVLVPYQLYRAGIDAALVAAVHRGDVRSAKQLLDAGAAVDARDAPNGWSRRRTLEQEFRRTAVMVAVVRRDAPMVRLLLQRGADLEARDAAEHTPLMLAALASRYPRHREGGALEVVEALLDRKPRLEARDGQGNTALLLAAPRGSAAVLTALLRRGADPRARNAAGETPALLTARGGRPRLARILFPQE
jgi:ankyrin repeat protein